jgi:serine/threonine-protein kinase
MSRAQTLEVPGYQVIEYLGSGAGSTIWHIRDKRTDEHLALKRVVKRHASDRRYLEQAINEHAIGVQLQHDAVRKIRDMRRIKRWWVLHEVHLIMELCEGKTIQEERPTDHAVIARIFSDVAQALAHINARGFVHADIKPNNILVSPRGRVKIIDLGQSCPIGTIKERIQGTPDFIAPEQVHRRPLDARTDVYNFGAALYWALVGKPIPTVLPRKGAMMVADLIIQPPIDVDTSIPLSISKLVMDCVETRPAARPASMNEVASRLGLIAHTLQRQAAGNGK